MYHPTNYDPSLVTQRAGSAERSETHTYGPNTAAIEDLVKRRIPSAAGDPEALKWWATQFRSYWRNWPPSQQAEWKQRYTDAREAARSSKRTRAWKRARKHAKRAAYEAGPRGTSQLVKAFHIACADAASALVVGDLNNSSFLLEPFELLEYGPNFEEFRGFLAEGIPAALQTREVVLEWTRRVDRERFESARRASTLTLQTAPARRPGAVYQAQWAGGAAMNIGMLRVLALDLEESDRNLLLSALIDKAASISFKPVEPTLELYVERLATPFEILHALAAGEGEPAWSGASISYLDLNFSGSHENGIDPDD